MGLKQDPAIGIEKRTDYSNLEVQPNLVPRREASDDSLAKKVLQQIVVLMKRC